MCNKIMKYFSKHVIYSSLVHFTAGVGVGIIIARPFDGAHPVRLGLILLGIAVAGYLIPLWTKK